MIYDNSSSQDEYDELVSLEYVLTHRYSDNIDKDNNRYMKLNERLHKQTEEYTMIDDLNNILGAFRFEFPDERTRQHILQVLNLYMNDMMIEREIYDYHIRDITGTSFPIDYTRLEFEIVYQRTRITNFEVMTLRMTSENNRLREPIAFGTIKKHNMI